MKPEVDINALGTIIKGINTHSVELLKKICSEGLKSQLDLKDPSNISFTIVPEFVSLSMVGKGGYQKTSASWLYGANNDRFGSSFSLVINPNYVRTHHIEFIAAGDYFRNGSIGEEIYRDENGQIPYGLRYEPIQVAPGWELFGDEVLARYIAGEAIYGIVYPKRSMNYLLEDLEDKFPENNLIIYDVSGKTY